MRIAVGGIFHESNAFSPVPTTIDRYEEALTTRGRAIFERFENTEWESAGCLDAARAHGDVELVGTVNAWAWPAGPLTDDTFRTLLDELKTQLADARADGIVLLLHGAMLTQSGISADATIVREVREAVGSRPPLGVTMDFHANVDPALVDHCDIIVGYDTYPHVDLRNTGRECTERVIAAVRGECRPVTAVCKVPLLPHILRQETAAGPMRELISAAQSAEAAGSILSASIFGGFFWADIAHAGLSAVVVADGDRSAAQSVADQLGAAAWERRQAFQASPLAPADAVRRAINADRGPVILVDLGDNVGGGSPGDGTTLLAELIRQKAHNAVLVIADRESAEACRRAGPGAVLDLNVGGKFDNLHGRPVNLRATVRSLHDGAFKNIGPMRDGIIDDMGPSAVVTADGITLLLTSLKMPMWNLQQLRACGIEPTEARIIVTKAAVAHRAAYLPIAAHNIEVDTPGITAVNMRQFPLRRLRRPIYPLDVDFTWSPT